jgi:4-hydroxy-2-oxoheptanedioate aldolase
MELPRNGFKRALAEGRPQIGLWCTLPGGYVAEVLAGAGFDWLLFDTEHSPSDPIAVLEQLRAAAAYPVSCVVRAAWNDAVLIKRFLDVGAQTLLLPYVQDAGEARAAVAAMRYPPRGVRGVSSISRATRFGRVADYARRAEEELCLLVQVETVEALGQIEAIAGVDGVDGIFVGPADLAASMGHPGAAGHPEVVAAIEDALRRIRRAGKPAGILTPDREFARRSLELGAGFVAVGVDTGLLVAAAEGLAGTFRDG